MSHSVTVDCSVPSCEATLVALLCDASLWTQTREHAFTCVLKMLSCALQANTALWTLGPDHETLHLRMQFNSVGNRLPAGDSRTAVQAPHYFAALDTNLTLATTDIASSASFADLIATHFAPERRNAALHVALRIQGQLWGVLCAEQTARPQPWRDDERNLLVGAGQLLAHLRTHYDNLRNAKLLKYATDNGPLGMIRISGDGRLLYRNKRWAEITGIQSPTANLEQLDAIVHPEDRANFRALARKPNENTQGYATVRLLHPDGSMRHVILYWVNTFDVIHDRPVPYSSLLQLIDITEQVEARQSLRVVAAHQRALIDGVAHAIISTDSEGLITSFNHTAERMLDYDADELIGKTTPELLHDPAEIAARAAELQRQYGQPVAAGFEAFVFEARLGLVSEREWTYVRRDGSRFPVLLSVTAIRDEDHELSGFVGIASDLSDRKRLENLQRDREQLIQHIMRGVSATVGEKFFDQLARELGNALEGCIVQGLELLPGITPPTGRTLMNTERVRRGLDIVLTHTPALKVLESKEAYHWPDVQTAFPEFEPLQNEHWQGCMSVPLLASDGTALGVLLIIKNEPIANPELALQLLQIFSVRAANELERMRHERELQTRAESQQWLLENSAQLHAQTTVNGVARIAAQALHRHSSTPRFSLGLSCPGGYRLIAYAGGHAATHAYNRVQARHDLHEKALRAPNHLYIADDLDASLADAPKLLKTLRARGTVALIVIALMDHDQEVGMAMLEYTDKPCLGHIDIESLLIYARSVGLALGKAMQQERLEYQATHDNLTGLFNRAVLHRDFASWQLIGHPQAALLLLDLDRFKEVNDTLGHQVGDQLLLLIGERLQQRLADRHSNLYRLGGDEFAIFAHDMGKTDALELARDMLVALHQPFALDDVNLEVGGSIGVAIHPEHGQDSHALLRSADVAMYKAKNSGAGIALYDRDLDLNSTERLAMIAEFRQGLREHELELYYQPKIDLRTTRPVGFEALVRWRHPRLGLLTPDRFLPLVEMTDTIHDLARYVIEQGCAQLQRWACNDQNTKLSINLSARNLIDDRIVNFFREHLTRCPAACSRLDVEITETALIHDPDRALSLMQRIAGLGVTFSIDDFGTGYSSLAYLRRMPISTLKIDRTFIHRMLDNTQDRLIVESTISLAHNLKLQVVAEGVENAEVVEQLHAMGCDQVQGYFIGPPVAAQDLPSRFVHA